MRDCAIAEYRLPSGMTREPETVYNTQQVAERLGVGAAMLRRYAQTLERITGVDVPHTRRDGRQFSGEHVGILLRAKSLIDANQGMGVETALKMSLSPSETAPDALTPVVGYGNSLELVDALTAAVARGNEPLLAEVRGLRQDLARLAPLAESETTTEQPGSRKEQDNDNARGGLLVQAAMWVKGLLRRKEQ